jgi:hypothetical protein
VTPKKPWSAKCPKSGTSHSASSHHTSRRRYPDRTTVRPRTSHQHYADNPPSIYLASCLPISPSWNQHVGTDPQFESSARINLVFPSSDKERTNPRCPTRDLRSNPRPRHPVAYLRISPHRVAHSMQPRCEIAHPGPSTHAKHGIPHVAGRQGFVRKKRHRGRRSTELIRCLGEVGGGGSNQ